LQAPGELPEATDRSSSIFGGRRPIRSAMEPVEPQTTGDADGRAVPAQLATGNRNVSEAPSALAEITPTLSIREVDLVIC
jgi:hypothetical protein